MKIAKVAKKSEKSLKKLLFLELALKLSVPSARPLERNWLIYSQCPTLLWCLRLGIWAIQCSVMNSSGGKQPSSARPSAKDYNAKAMAMIRSELSQFATHGDGAQQQQSQQAQVGNPVSTSLFANSKQIESNPHFPPFQQHNLAVQQQAQNLDLALRQALSQLPVQYSEVSTLDDLLKFPPKTTTVIKKSSMQIYANKITLNYYKKFKKS